MNIKQDFITAYKEHNEKPSFLISTSYFRKESNLEKIYKNNKRINKVINDLFNPRKHLDFNVSINHFIEARKKTLDNKATIIIKNTITNEYELDNEKEISKPIYDTHHIIGNIKDSTIIKPNKNIKKLLLELYGSNNPPQDLDYEQIKMDLIMTALKKRCPNFIGKSHQSLNILPIHESNGAIAYVTKQIKTIEDYSNLFDIKNSSIIPR